MFNLRLKMSRKTADKYANREYDEYTLYSTNNRNEYHLMKINNPTPNFISNLDNPTLERKRDPMPQDDDDMDIDADGVKKEGEVLVKPSGSNQLLMIKRRRLILPK